jgi:hypothetical protein
MNKQPWMGDEAILSENSKKDIIDYACGFYDTSKYLHEATVYMPTPTPRDHTILETIRNLKISLHNRAEHFYWLATRK